MRRVGSLALMLGLVSACAAFGKGDDTPSPTTPDAGGPHPSEAVDAGDATRGETAPPAFVVAPPKCPAAHVFCDDFESVAGWSSEWTEKVVNDKSKPDALLEDQPLPASLGQGHALHVVITPNDDHQEADAYLRKELGGNFAKDKTTIVLRYRFYPVQAHVSYVRFGSWVTILNGSGYDAHGASIREPDEFLTHGSAKDLGGTVPGIMHSTGAWHLVVVTLSRTTVSDPFTRETRIDDQVVDTRAVNLSQSTAVSDLEFGAYSSTHTGLGGTFEAWLDDVVFTAE